VSISHPFAYGFLCKRVSLGYSVAKASEAKESIIRLTHSIYIEFRGESLRITPPKSVINTATTLHVS